MAEHPQSPMYPGVHTNTLAVGAIVTAFLIPILGFVLGILAHKQIRITGESGDGMAKAAIWLGAIFTIAQVAFVAVIVANTGDGSGGGVGGY